MLVAIINLLKIHPNLKAKDIAKKLNRDKTDVNSLLYRHEEHFKKNEEHGWRCINDELKIEFPTGWISCREFESALEKVGCLFKTNSENIIFVIPKGGQLLLEAIARLMALCNQLSEIQKKITLDFTQQPATLKYVNRLGFFDYLTEKVAVLPQRPETSTAKVYKNNSNNMVELDTIDPTNLDESIPERFKNVFVTHAGAIYEQTAFTVIAESYGNVRDHSESPILGFIGLQCYKNTQYPHIQTVISDSGRGILGTLKPLMQTKYPELVERMEQSKDDSDVFLLKEIFTKGHISQSEEEGRGLGLNSTVRAASKFNATVLVRQENCEARFYYRNSKLKFEYQTNMPTIKGTHICFDFKLDNSSKSL